MSDGYNTVHAVRKLSNLVAADELKKQLPEIGIRIKKPMYTGKGEENPAPRWCKVVGVNYDHLWYRVEFEGVGISQCFKIPERKG